jgi:hypothetical protein
MKRLKIVRHSDPGHSWYAVKRSRLEALGLIDKISACSYQRGDTVYLEEDQDASLLWYALVKPLVDGTFNREALLDVISIRDSYRNRSPIRRYESFKQ